MSKSDKKLTGGILVIGDEILSGRTADKNINFLARVLFERGVKLKEARVIGDYEEQIIEAVREFSERYDIVLTTGGIGPTHDDITTRSVGKAFGKEVSHHPEADKRLKEYYKEADIEYNEQRRKMAEIPAGADLIDNPISVAPGFVLGNVYVLPGVPSILEAMVEGLGGLLPEGLREHSLTVQCNLGEGTVASGLPEIESRYKDVRIGSYPWFKLGASGGGSFGTALVVSGLSEADVKKASEDIIALIVSLGGEGSIE